MLSHSEVMNNTSVKRKVDDALMEDDGSMMWSNDGIMPSNHMHYPGQRQCVLNMSVCKLHKTPQRRIEPSLRRSVLIFNTLRYIENELKMEGYNVTQSAMSDGLIPVLDTPTHELDLDTLPTTPDHPMCPPQRTSRTPSPVALGDYNSCLNVNNHVDMAAMDYCVDGGTSLEVSMESSMESSIEPCSISSSSCSMMSALSSPPSCDATPILSAITSCCTPTAPPQPSQVQPTSITTFDLDSASITTTTTSVAVATNTPDETVHHPPASDIFADIDVSRYDFDYLSPFSVNPSGASNNKLIPMNCDDIVHSINSEHKTNSKFTALRNERPSTFRNDLLSDDLDHIMQVLVGI